MVDVAAGPAAVLGPTGDQVHALEVVRPSLEDVYLGIIGEHPPASPPHPAHPAADTPAALTPALLGGTK